MPVGPWLVVAGEPSRRVLENPDGPGWVSFRLEFLQPLGMTGFAAEHRCGRVRPVDLDNVEGFSIEDLLTSDGVSTVATPE